MLLFLLSLWTVTGGIYGLTCPKTSNASAPAFNETYTCSNLTIPNCVDRTVYCSNPPDQYPQGSINVNQNPSLAYKKLPGEL